MVFNIICHVTENVANLGTSLYCIKYIPVIIENEKRKLLEIADPVSFELLIK